MKSTTTVSLLILILAFLLFSMVNNTMLSGVRFDLTENSLYTLSDGSLSVIDEIDEPINLYFFFSEKVSEDLTSLRAYAQRVREMLEEYEVVADGRIRLEIVDPEPFSEDEDRAAGFGLQSVPVNQSGDELYFGLVGTNAVEGQEAIAFFQPDREEFLEYELTKLIYNLAQPDKPGVKVLSGLDIDGSVNPQTFQTREAWIFLTQLRELFDVEMLSDLDRTSVDPADLLLLVHPGNLDETALYAIDQHVMSGGRLIAFMDPMAEMEAPSQPGMNMPGQGGSNLNQLTAAWGITLRTDEILADSNIALMVGGPDGRPTRHLGILGFNREQLSADSIATAALETVNMSTAGVFDIDEIAGIEVEPLITSSRSAATLPAMQFQFMSSPEELQQGFTPTGETYTVALRVSGQANSAFPDGIDGVAEEPIVSTDQLQVVLVGDTDLLADRLWVQVQNFFGQQIASAFADNGSLVTNLVDQFTGSNALIEVRSRGQFTRPFTVVEELRRKAEAKYLESAEALQLQLQQTEQQLSELEASRQNDGLLTLSPEQTRAVEQFEEEKLRIRKELRDVRHQLDSEIEDLGSMLKFLNVLLMPLLLTGLLLTARYLGLAGGEKPRSLRVSEVTGGSA